MLGSSLPPVVFMGFMSFLRYLCALAHSGVQHILCCVFLFLFVLCFVYPMLPVSLDCFCFVCLVFCVPYVASFSGLSIFFIALQHSLTFT